MASKRNITRKLRGIETHLALRQKRREANFNKVRRSYKAPGPVKLSKRNIAKIDKKVAMNVNVSLRRSARLEGKTRNFKGESAGKLSAPKKSEIAKAATSQTLSFLYPSRIGPSSGILKKKVDDAWRKRIATLASANRSPNRNESHSLPANLVNALNRSARISVATHRARTSANRSRLATIAEGANEAHNSRGNRT
jgi:hypothetical protein